MNNENIKILDKKDFYYIFVIDINSQIQKIDMKKYPPFIKITWEKTKESYIAEQKITPIHHRTFKKAYSFLCKHRDKSISKNIIYKIAHVQKLKIKTLNGNYPAYNLHKTHEFNKIDFLKIYRILNDGTIIKES